MAYFVTYPSSNGDRRYARRFDTPGAARGFVTRLIRGTNERRKVRSLETVKILMVDEDNCEVPYEPTITPPRGGSAKPKAKPGDIAAWLAERLADGDRVPPALQLREHFRRTDIEDAMRLFRTYPSFGFRVEDGRNPRSPLVRDSRLDP